MIKSGKKPSPQKTLLTNNHCDLQLMATQEEYSKVFWTCRMGDSEAEAQPQLRRPVTAEEEKAVRNHLHKLAIHKPRGPGRRHPQVIAELTNVTGRPLCDSLNGHGNRGRLLMMF